MTNDLLFRFIIGNLLFIVLLIALVFASVIKIIPPEWSGLWKYNNNRKEDGSAPKLTFLNFILLNFFDSIVRSVFLPLISSFGLKNMVTLIIFIVVIFDFFFRHQISGQGVTLISVGIVALYLERLIETGKRISLFGGLLTWEKEDQSKS